MNLTEDMLKYAMKYVLEHAPEEMEFFNSFVDKTVLERMNNVINSDFGRITYTEAIKVLQESGADFKYPVEWELTYKQSTKDTYQKKSSNVLYL